ncbi:MAG: modulator protein [Bacteroidales bacterium 45-6]|nr:MAG: modulator protein [Bacteroidales bacterium 45-6]
MITQEQKDIAQGCMEFALKNGCQQARISFAVADNSSFDFRNTQLDKLQQSSENKLYIELFVDGRYGSFSTNRLEREEVQALIREGITSTRFLAQDLARRLPDSSRYYLGKGDGLELYDDAYLSINVNSKIDLLKQTTAEVYGKDKRVISVTSSYEDNRSAEYMVASNGFEAFSQDSSFSLSSEVALKTDTDARPESFWYDSTIFWKDLQKEGIARKAFERALGKVGQKQTASGKYQLLLDNTQASRIVSPLISALMGTSLQQKNSFLIDRLGKQIMPPSVTIHDTPHLARSFGARWYDGEGVATSDLQIIEKGVLQTYFIDTYNSVKMGVEPTISSPSILNFELGNTDFNGLLRQIEHGIWVSAFNGGNTNQTTGDFSMGIEGFLIKDGKVVSPIGEMNITGNILDLWKNLVAVGNDPRKNSPWKIPALLFEGVLFNGL